MADILKQEFGVEVDLIEGNKNEFSVWVDNKLAAKNGWISFPTDKDILSAVRRELES